MPKRRQTRLFPMRLLAVVSLAFLLVTGAVSGGIWLSSLMGTCLDEEGKPIPGAILRFTDAANGRHFEVTSNAEGRFTYIAVQSSRYRLDIIRNRKPLVSFANIDLQWSSQPLLLEINLQSNSVKVTRQVLLAESFRTESPPPTIASPANGDESAVRAINQQIAAAKAFMDAENWASARAAAKAATEIDPKRDLPWAWLAYVYCEEAARATAPSDSALQNCVQNYQYAIAIAPSATYYNNLGAAYSAMKQWKEAVDNFRAAEQLNPDHAALYSENLGAAILQQADSMPNSDAQETLQLAVQAFSQAASAVPPIAEAYYWEGLCQLRLAALNAPGSSYKSAQESFESYMQLAPAGHYASQARAMVDSLKDLADAGHLEVKP